jgi:hypothetical protein
MSDSIEAESSSVIDKQENAEPNDSLLFKTLEQFTAKNESAVSKKSMVPG